MLTALAFTVVVGLLIVLLAFVNGMYKLNESTGIPGNVFVLSDGSTDELFSNLGYGDVDNVERVTVTLDANGGPLPEPVRVPRRAAADGTPTVRRTASRPTCRRGTPAARREPGRRTWRARRRTSW